MLIGGDVVQSEGTFRWVPLQEIYSVRLTEGESEKTIRAVFRNGIDNESEEVEARISLDISPPTIQSVEVFDTTDETDDDLIFHSGQLLMFQALAGESEAGLEGFISIKDAEEGQQKFDTGSQDMTDDGNGRYTFILGTEGIAEGKYSCEIVLEDIAEHSAVDTVEIVLDNQGPSNPSISMDIEGPFSDSRTVEVILRADGEPAEVFIAGDVVNDIRTHEWIDFSADGSDEDPSNDEMRVSVNLRGTDGEKKVTAMFRDKGRSESTEAEVEISLELKNPELADSCRIIQTADEPSQAYLALQFDEPIKRIELKDFFVVLRDKIDSQNLIQLDGTSTVPMLSNDTVVIEILNEQLDEIRQWQPMTFAESFIQIEIAENGVFDLADKGNLSNESTPADGFFTLPDSSIQVIVEPTSFSPNEDEVKDKIIIVYSPARTSDATIRITNSQKETIREWQVESQTGGLVYSIEWDGKMADNSPYPDGEYSLDIISSEVGAIGFAYGQKRSFFIDNSAPQIVDISPWEGARVPALFRASLSVVDNPKLSGIEIVYMTILGDIENKFPLAKSEVEGEYVLPATLQLELPSGKQDISFHAVDMAGNETEKTLTYTVVTEVEAVLSVMNFPNPFSPGDMTNIRYYLPEEARSGELAIYDAGGDMVFFKDLASEELEYGEHTFQWDGRDMFGNSLARGIYFCRIWIDADIEEDKSKIHKIAIR